MEISAKLVKELRDRTGAGMMECKKALIEAKGNLAEAEIYSAQARHHQGVKQSHAHHAARHHRQLHSSRSQLGVLVEVNCESDFVARTDDFQHLVKDLAMQVAAADPQFIRKEDVTAEALDKENDIQRARALQEGKPEKMVDKIVEGRLAKFYEEICLYEQPFIRENSTTIGDLIKAAIAKLGENISVSRFVRFKVGEAALIEETAETDRRQTGLRSLAPRHAKIPAHRPQTQR